ncbi:hypothetical protein OKB92_05405 [Methylorubrum extorquens]|nr:hypothetical protein [Methylorubrum extorquens]UYW26606.1 hypothetical protein OKC48_25700 [Methylorubrum extorquens]UYW33519.1 hypothetical protein OKB92_05405 [Methylorubrum extorquens]
MQPLVVDHGPFLTEDEAAADEGVHGRAEEVQAAGGVSRLQSGPERQAKQVAGAAGAMKAGRQTLLLAPEGLAQAGGGAEAGVTEYEAGVLTEE